MQTKNSFASSTASVLLDALRGVAALLVLLEHWRNLFFVDYGQIRYARAFWGGLYLLFGAGHQAVIVFFILSGYLVGGSVFRSFDRNQWRWSQYLTHRLVRLWLVLVPALLLGALWDGIGILTRHAPELYAGLVSNHMVPNVHQTLHWNVFWANLFFLQTILTPPLGSNGALWSLANEFWYYLLFPLGLCAIVRSYSPMRRFFYTSSFILLCFFIGKDILLYFPIWLLGAVLYRLPCIAVSTKVRTWAAIAYAYLFFALCAIYRSNGRIGALECSFLRDIGSDYLLALATALLLLTLLSAANQIRKTRMTIHVRSLARFSYTLYVAHTPFLVLLSGLLNGDNRLLPGIQSILIASAMLVLTVSYSWLVASVTEFKTDKIRSALEGHIKRIKLRTRVTVSI